MKVWIFWGSFTAVALGLLIVCLVLRRKVLALWRGLFGSASLKTVVNVLQKAGPEPPQPKSVSGMDRILLPDILRDFPDFDANMAKTYAKDYLRQQLHGRRQLRIHKVAISDYRPSGAQKTIVFQASAGYRDGGQTVEKRWELDYSYLLSGDDKTVAANCPNCGATLGYGEVECPYCGSRVVNVMKNTWAFTQMREI